MRALSLQRFWLNALSAAMLTACAGGGGGGGGSPPGMPSPPAPPPPPPTYPAASSSEYLTDWAIADVRANAAWAQNATGQGIVVGIVDNGADASSAEIGARLTTTDIATARHTPYDPAFTHGSELAALIGGAYNNSSTVGVAFNATLLSVRADDGAAHFQDVDLGAAIDYAVAHSVRVINLSLGASSPSGTAFRDAIARATNAGVIVVVSAGNDGNSAPDVNYPGRYATDPSIAHGLIVVAGAHGKNLLLASFSNPAGPSANFYLTAPGDEIIVPDFGAPGGPAGFQDCATVYGAGFCRVQGTSYSAPLVTGAVALLLQAFPSLTPAQAVQLLLSATDDAGAAGVDAVYGHGRLNLSKAFAPVGTLSAPIGAASVTPGATTLGVSGLAFGDAFLRPNGAWRAAAFDSFGRTFYVDLASNWRMAGRAGLPTAPALWRGTRGAWGAASLAFAQDDGAPASLHREADIPDASFLSDLTLGDGVSLRLASGATVLPSASVAAQPSAHFGLAGAEIGAALRRDLAPGVTLDLAMEQGRGAPSLNGRADSRTATAARLTSRLGRWSAAALYGALDDPGSVLGLNWAAPLGGAANADTRFGGLALGVRIAPGLDLAAEAELGVTRTTGGGWLTVSAPLRTSAFALSARLDADPPWLTGVDGAWSLSLSQPIRVERGGLAALFPMADFNGRSSLAFERRPVEVAPSGREMDLSLRYEMWAADAMSFNAALTRASEPGHVRDVPAETAFSVGLRLAR